MSEGLSLLDEYERNVDVITRSNANFNMSFSALQAYVVGEILEQRALSLLDDEERRNHMDKAFYIHNLREGFYCLYCHGGSLQSILARGIHCGDVTSNPPAHFDSACDQLVNYLMMITQEVSGAVALSDFNTLLAPYVYYDNLSWSQVCQVIQRLIFNLAFPSRKAFQNPFSNLTFNLECPKQLSSIPVVIGGVDTGRTFGEFEKEANMVLQAFTDVFSRGDGAGRMFTFPIPTVNLTKRTDFGSDTFRRILENVVSLGSFSFMNYIGSGIDENGVRAMCCRLNLNLKELSQARGLWNMGDGTGSLCVVTLNLGRLGYLVRKGENGFDYVDRLLKSARKVFKVKRNMVEKSLKLGYLPLSKFYDLNLDHYFNTVGILGLNEMYLNMDGYGLYCHVDEAVIFLDYINTRLREFQEEDGVLYNLEITPAEESAGKVARRDKELFPDIITQGEEYPYYTSMLIPPSDNIFWTLKLNAESKLLPKFSGGTVHRLFGAKEDTVDSMRGLIKFVSSQSVPYFDYTPTVSFCPNCRSNKVGVLLKCPDCGGLTEIYSRVVGFMKKVSKWSDTRQEEFWDRRYIDG